MLITKIPILPIKCTCGYAIGGYANSIVLYAKAKKISLKEALKAFNINRLCCINPIMTQK